MMNKIDRTRTYTFEQESSLAEWVQKLASKLPDKLHIHLIGDLGAGKTTLTRHLLHALGHPGFVKSPTFTLVESYDLAQHRVFHFDLYRLNDPQELYFIGIEDYLSEPAICLIEWADKAKDLLPQPDLMIRLAVRSATSRDLTLTAESETGYVIAAQV